MTREERRALLGDEVVERIRREAAAAPPPDAALIEALRMILAHPALPAEAPGVAEAA